MAATMTVVGLSTAGLQTRLKSGFAGTRLTPVRSVKAVTRPARIVTKASVGGFPSNWLPKNGVVVIAGFLGWTIPSAIPVSAFGGSSLFAKFLGAIGEHLAKFPQGPPLNDEFWLYLITWHVGLFVTLTLGQIGVNGRKQWYW